MLADFKQSVLPVSVKESKPELFVCLNAAVESEFGLSVCPDFIIESDVVSSVHQISINGSECELSVQFQSLKCLPVQLQLIHPILNCQSLPYQHINLFVKYLPVQFPSMSLILNCLS